GLSSLKSIAEEWDLDLALDLIGPIDWLWEAEAAVARMMPRLRYVRLVYPLPTLDAQVRSRMTQRTIAACVDMAFSGTIAVATPLPFWHWRNPQALEMAAGAAVDRLELRFGVSRTPSYWETRQRSPHL